MKMYDSISDSDDSTSGSDNNCTILQHNKGRIAVESDEEEIHKNKIRRMMQESICGEELKNRNNNCGEELNTIKIISVVKELNTAQYAWCRDDIELHTWYN